MSEEKKKSNGDPLGKGSSDDRRSFSASSEKRVVIKSADMNEDMQKEAVDIAVAAFKEHIVEKDVAESIKKEFDKKHGPTWHCIVGRNFGSYVTHETNHFVYFYLDQKAVLLFKSDFDECIMYVLDESLPVKHTDESSGLEQLFAIHPRPYLNS